MRLSFRRSVYGTDFTSVYCDNEFLGTVSIIDANKLMRLKRELKRANLLHDAAIAVVTTKNRPLGGALSEEKIKNWLIGRDFGQLFYYVAGQGLRASMVVCNLLLKLNKMKIAVA